MACKITFELLTESQTGTIGNDWKYELEAKIFSGRRIGEGTIKVKKHDLESGDTQKPPGPPAPMVLPAGEPGDDIRVALKLSVAEVDLFENDTGEMSTELRYTCPPAGSNPIVEERELSVGVVEQPSGIGTAEFTLCFQVTLAAE